MEASGWGNEGWGEDGAGEAEAMESLHGRATSARGEDREDGYLLTFAGGDILLFPIKALGMFIGAYVKGLVALSPWANT